MNTNTMNTNEVTKVCVVDTGYQTRGEILMVNYRALPPTAGEAVRMADQWDKANTNEVYPRRGIDPQIIALADHLDATENALAAAYFATQGINELKRELVFAQDAQKKNAVRAELRCAMRSALETVSVLRRIMDDYENQFSLVRINAPDVGATSHQFNGYYGHAPELQGEEWKGYDHYKVVTAIILNDLDIDLRTALQRCQWFKEDWAGYIRDFGFPT